MHDIILKFLYKYYVIFNAIAQGIIVKHINSHKFIFITHKNYSSVF